MNITGKSNIIEIVYVVGKSAAGKTFSGDYFSLVHGYTHIDGDGPVKKQHQSRKFKTISTNFYKAVQVHWPKNQDGDATLWRPYMDELVEQTLEATKDHNKVVLTHATYRQNIRDYVIEQLQKQQPYANITVIELKTDVAVEREAIYYRNKKLASKGLPTMEDQMRAMGWKIEGRLKKRVFIKFYAKYLEVPYEHHSNEKSKKAYNFSVIDVSKRDVTHFRQLDKAIGHRDNNNSNSLLSSSSSYDNICDQIKKMSAQREKEYYSTTKATAT